ncbi:MAG: monovalent cation/H+ antiporter complex subunit F, partial [Pigmentiphaga sp.]
MMDSFRQVDHFLTTASYVLLVLMAIPLGMTLVRMLAGPSYADRFVALDMLTGVAVSIAALTAATTGRREYMDVGLGLALFGFLGTCALSAFLER